MEENEFRQLWNMLRKRWLMVLGLPLLAALIIGILSVYVITPIYLGTNVLIIERKPAESSLEPSLAAAQVLLNNNMLQQHIKNYIEMAKSRTVEKNVLKELKLPLSIDELDKMILVTQVKTTDLLKIEVTHEDPKLAAALANSVALQFSKVALLDNVRVVDAADIPTKPIKPNKAQNVLFAFLVGCILSLSLAILLEYLDNTVKTSRDVKKLLGLPVLGLIANYGQQGKKAAANSLITLEQTRSPISEAYRVIRTNLEFASLDSGHQKILITSSSPEEGKSLTVANLAVSMAQAGKSVLVVDADLRNPMQHKLFGLDNRQGLSEVLVQEGDYLDYFRDTNVPGLMVLTGGPIPHNPAELVGSQRMKSLLEETSGQFDLVILDTPSVIEVTDATILAQQVDGVVLVLAAGQVKKDQAYTAKEHMDNVGAKLLGVVLNKVDMKIGEYPLDRKKKKYNAR